MATAIARETDIVRRAFATGKWMVVWIVAACLLAGGAFANYLGTKNAFTLLNTDRTPLGKDELIGQFLGALFPRATQADVYAAVLSGIAALGWFALFYNVERILTFYRQRRDALAEGNTANARQDSEEIRQHVLWAVVALAFLGWVIVYDVSLIRYRATVAAFDVDEAVRAIKLADPLAVGRSGAISWAVTLASKQAYTTVAATALASLLLEFATLRLDQCFVLLMDAIASDADQVDILSTDADDVAQAQADDVFADRTHAQLAAHTELQSAAHPQDVLHTDLSDAGPAPTHTEGWWRDEATVTTNASVVAGSEAPPVPTRNEAAHEVLFPVIGDDRGAQVGWEVALADEDRYYVDMSCRRVFDRRYHQRLTAETDSIESEAQSAQLAQPEQTFDAHVA